MYTLDDCEQVIRECQVSAIRARSTALREYWRELELVWDRRKRDMEKAALKAFYENRRGEVPAGPNALKDHCPDPAHWGADQYKCLKCGRVWDRDDDKPNCHMEG